MARIKTKSGGNVIQITEFSNKNRKIITEYGTLKYIEWLEKEKNRIGKCLIQERDGNEVALFKI